VNTERARLVLLMASTRGPRNVERHGAPVTVHPKGWFCRGCRISGTWRGDPDSTPILLAAFVQRHQRCA